jgi:hypothetical protein
MRISPSLKIVGLAATLGLGLDAHSQEIICDRVLEDFAAANETGLPKGWKSNSSNALERAGRDKLYQVASGSEGNFLQAKAKGSGLTLALDIKDWDLKKHPILRWKWRVHELPKNASEDSSRNDAAASVYVIWKSSLIMRVKSIKFTWSSTLAAGTHLKKRFDNDHVHVLRSGESGKGEWITESINVRELAAKYHPGENDPPLGIAVLTDGDATQSPASADYADFVACRQAETKSAQKTQGL